MTWLGVSALEWAANVAMAVSVWLAARGRVATWPVGIAGCLLFGWLFAGAGLYAEVSLQAFFIGTSLWGWRQWARAGGPAELATSSGRHTPGLQPRRWALLLGAALLLTAGHGAALKHWTDAYAPYWDSAVLGSSIVAQLLLMRGHPHTWPAWIVVNTLSVPLYLQRELYATALLYFAFWLNAWHGWWHWRLICARRPG